jgi:hypothetical protein
MPYLYPIDDFSRSAKKHLISLSSILRMATNRDRRPLRESLSIDSTKLKGESSALSKMTLSA